VKRGEISPPPRGFLGSGGCEDWRLVAAVPEEDAHCSSLESSDWALCDKDGYPDERRGEDSTVARGGMAWRCIQHCLCNHWRPGQQLHGSVHGTCLQAIRWN